MISREEILRQERLNGGRRNVELRRLFNEQRATQRAAKRCLPVSAQSTETSFRTRCLTCSHAKRKEGLNLQGGGTRRLTKEDMVKVTIQNPRVETKQVKARGGGTRTMRRAYGTCAKGHKVSLILKNKK